MTDPVELLSAAAFALLGAALVLLAIARWTRAPAPVAAADPGPAVFLFEGDALVDASPPARTLLEAAGGPGRARGPILKLLARGFGTDLPQRLAAMSGGRPLRLSSPSGHGTLEAEESDGLLRLTLRRDGPGDPAIDSLSLEAAREELDLLRGLAESAPQPIWAGAEDGRLVWANRAYFALAGRVAAGAGVPADGGWPSHALFAAARPGDPLRRRESLTVEGRAEPLWFDVTEVPRGRGTLGFAAEVSDLVEAEAARLHFVQALAKTFAHLSTGLAIFDRDRRLVLFNPAFVDLTGLPAPLLSGRPLVHSVLDRLRETGVLPEPRDYAAWREEVAALEAAAERGEFQDRWTLPSGRTLRVTGRPHPDGALVFLFEDISAELGEARRLRAGLDAALAALEAGGARAAILRDGDADGPALAGPAYRDAWGPPEPALGAELARWRAAGADPAALDALARHLAGPATPWEGEVAFGGAPPLRVAATPLPRGGVALVARPS